VAVTTKVTQSFSCLLLEGIENFESDRKVELYSLTGKSDSIIICLSAIMSFLISEKLDSFIRIVKTQKQKSNCSNVDLRQPSFGS